MKICIFFHWCLSCFLSFFSKSFSEQVKDFLGIVLFFPVFLISTQVNGLDTVVWRPAAESSSVTTVGRVLVVAQDKSILFQDRAGEIYPIEYDMIEKATRNSLEFTPMTREELSEYYLERLPSGFRSMKTSHFVLFFKTSREYARWNGLLLERLYSAFENYWTNRGFDLKEPEFPLFCLIFPNSKEYHAFAESQGEKVGSSVIAYYSFQTNRIVCYDLSGQETEAGEKAEHSPGTSDSAVNFLTFTREILRRPNAEKQVATIIHEAAHQLAHNRGLANRFGDVPLWFNEGIALFFESPNLRSEKGWSGIGRPNPFWLPYFREYLSRRPEGQLEQLLTNDSLFQTMGTVQEAYAESWTLTWFLMKTRPEKYLEYVRKMGEKPILIWDSHEERLEDFESVFGPVEKLEKEFLRYVKRARF